ncbi:MAG: TatD family hydrolase [Clostridia bacterium]|nr:TatD family hydrolase [Clostridia bacterium]
MIDVHCHYEDDRFNEDRDEVISSLFQNNVTAVIDAGCTIKDCKMISALAEKYPQFYFCAGIHPGNADEFDENALKELKKLWAEEKCVGVGEIGLDYYWENNPPKDKQKDVFVALVNSAKEINKPVVIHSRDAIGDMLDLIKQENISHGVMHCFSESKETAKICLDAGLYFSFGGTCTFKNAVRANENLLYIPKDRILLETDSPYLAPVPNRGKRNDSTNLQFVIEHIAMLWNTTPKEVERITDENAKRLFNII